MPSPHRRVDSRSGPSRAAFAGARWARAHGAEVMGGRQGLGAAPRQRAARRWHRPAAACWKVCGLCILLSSVCLPILCVLLLTSVPQHHLNNARNYLHISVPGALDALYNEGYLSTPPTIARDKRRIAVGESRLAASRAVFVGLVSDSDACAARRFLPQLEDLRGLFNETYAVVVTPRHIFELLSGDGPAASPREVERLLRRRGSGDGGDHEGGHGDAAAVLQDWHLLDPSRNRVSPERPDPTDVIADDREATCPAACAAQEAEGAPLPPGTSDCRRCRRFRVLGALRNQQLAVVAALEAELGWAFDHIVSVDLDLWGIDILGFKDTFGRDEPWDAVCAHGVYFHSMYWDTTAFRLPDGTRPERLGIQQLMDGATRDEAMLQLSSCFGGLAVFRRAAVEGCRYLAGWPANRYKKECEHVSFMQCLHANGGGVYSNSLMKTFYGPHHFRRAFDLKKNPTWWCEPVKGAAG